MKLLSLVLVSAAHLALVQASAEGNGFGLDNMVQRTSYVTPQTPPAAGGPSTATGNSGSSSQTPATAAPATPAPATPQCSDACGALYQPVCGSDGKTYSNECSLSVASCKNPELKLMVQSSGACTQGSGAAQVTPPSDGDAASPSTASGSTTTAPVTSTCKQTCSKIRKPVCGSDGNTYSNLCLLKNAQCDNSKIVQMADDKCSPTTTSTGGSSASTGTSTGDSSTSTSTSTGDSKGPVTSTGGSGSTSSTKCTTMCTMDLDPVCGSDGKTYSNPCALKNAQCENPTSNIVLKTTGACQPTTSTGGPGSPVNQGSTTGGTGTSSSTSNCPSICTADYKPVCGSDGKTYSNKCQLSIAKCKNPTSSISLQSEGECAANTASPGSSTGGSSSTTTGSSTSTSGNSATTGSSSSTTTTTTTGSTATTGSSTSTTGNSGTTGSSTSGNIAAGTKQPLPTEPVKVVPSKCEMVCTKEYAPVCGSNGKTYTNSCALKLANCKSGKKEITIRSEGACVKPSTSTLQKPSGFTSTTTSTSGSIAPVSGTGSSLASGSTTTTTTSKGSGATTSTTTGTTGTTGSTSTTGTTGTIGTTGTTGSTSTTGASTTATATSSGKGTYLRGPASGNSPVQGNL